MRASSRLSSVASSGIVIGIVFGYAVISRLGSLGLTFEVPWGQLIVFLVVAGLVGVLAAVLPARRASRIDILDAIHYE